MVSKHIRVVDDIRSKEKDHSGEVVIKLETSEKWLPR